MAQAPTRDSYNRQSLTNGVNDAVKAVSLFSIHSSLLMQSNQELCVALLPVQRAFRTAHCTAYVDHCRKRKHGSSDRAAPLYHARPSQLLLPFWSLGNSVSY